MYESYVKSVLIVVTIRANSVNDGIEVDANAIYFQALYRSWTILNLVSKFGYGFHHWTDATTAFLLKIQYTVAGF